MRESWSQDSTGLRRRGGVEAFGGWVEGASSWSDPMWEGDENSKSEARNPKQIQMTESEMFQTGVRFRGW